MIFVGISILVLAVAMFRLGEIIKKKEINMKFINIPGSSSTTEEKEEELVDDVDEQLSPYRARWNQ